MLLTIYGKKKLEQFRGRTATLMACPEL